MASSIRQLPHRQAREQAQQRINLRNAEEDDDIVFPDTVEEDDVVADDPVIRNFSDNEEDSVDDEELEASDLEQEESDGSNSSEDDMQVDATQLESASGLRWSIQALQGVQGRQPVRNVFIGNSGYRRGLRPATRREAFLIFMQEFISTAVTYTNVAGRRLGREVGWRNTDDIEMEAFIGLHIIQGKYDNF